MEKKIKSMEDFVENKLKNDLREVELLFSKKVENYNEWQDLKKFIKHIQTHKPDVIDTTFNMGLGVHVCARMEEFDKLIVKIGCDCYLEMYYDEADKYANIRLKYLSKEMDFLKEQAVIVKAHIKLVLLGIAELRAKEGRL